MKKVLCVLLMLIALGMTSLPVLADGPWIDPGTDNKTKCIQIIKP